jgi:hypothetical protein
VVIPVGTGMEDCESAFLSPTRWPIESSGGKIALKIEKTSFRERPALKACPVHTIRKSPFSTIIDLFKTETYLRTSPFLTWS